ncbi:hypothetical protein [Tenacibaculum sp. M341]|uniref:hypothetical protein n=1 Tax=Tenacibaculum sp. M341 TaxID=2530339 RepID=UPI001042D250|nr:hypothetical protein [Tenacibaculum sp. M341]TCI91412.1 hypothetical protein EYW44_10675 [Tenacibaculum sp. M341]
MKKILSILLVLGLVITSTAQKRKEKKDQFTVEQRTELTLKKMTLHLDLSKGQQNKIRPLIAESIAKKKNRKSREEMKKLTKDERFQLKMNELDAKIALKNRMKNILDNQQFEKYEKHLTRKHRRMSKRKMKIDKTKRA